MDIRVYTTEIFFTLITPVVQIGSDFLTYNDLFNGDELRKERIKELIENEAGERKRDLIWV